MNDWAKFNETALPKEGSFYSHVKMEDVADADYTNTKRVFRNFEIKICVFKVIHYC